jgi:hypothetical protein
MRASKSDSSSSHPLTSEKFNCDPKMHGTKIPDLIAEPHGMMARASDTLFLKTKKPATKSCWL